ncbi:phage protein [Paraburkholderia sp. MM5477-R1]|uniref:phage protein n=1 Tax=Paraburkholderia sp. MM5477-R1 TaxID=2991062 RepID=UPI003D2492E4
MTMQFGRRWRLEIGNRSESFAIEALRIKFEIDKSLDEKPNPAKLSVYNLNRDHMNLIVSKGFNLARLSVGYNELRLLYQGDIVKPSTKRDKTDWITSFECGDGSFDYASARVWTTLQAGATDEHVLTEATKAMTRTKAGVAEVNNVRTMPRGKLLMGNARDVVRTVARNNGADWSIQDGELMVLPADKVLPGEGFVLSQETGMIDSPKVTDNGLEVKCLLNPQIRIGGLVRVESMIEAYNGDYKVVRVKYVGDTHTSDWYCGLVVRGGQFQKVKKSKAGGAGNGDV